MLRLHGEEHSVSPGYLINIIQTSTLGFKTNNGII